MLLMSTHNTCFCGKPISVAQLDACPTGESGDQEVVDSIPPPPPESSNILSESVSERLPMKYFQGSFSYSFPLIKNGSCQFLGKVWLGKLTGST